MVKKSVLSVVVCMVLALVGTGVSAPGAGAAAYEIKWGTAPAGGVWQALGTAMLGDVLKANPQLKGSTLPIGGAANVVAVQEGKLNAAFSFSTTAWEAWEGQEFFKKYGPSHDICTLGALFPEPTQICVFEKSGITDVMQLKGKRITPGPKGSAIEVVTRQVLRAYGISFDDVNLKYMSFSEAGQQMIDGHIDAIVYGAMAYPAPPIVRVSSQKQKIRLLPLSKEIIQTLLKDYPGLQPYTLPPGSYQGVDYAVPGIAAEVVLIGRKDMPEDVAYAIVKSIATNFDNYTSITKAIALGKKEDMGKKVGVDYHPGALKFYKEMGWVK
jgi:hypothetical protein